ncbi:hypothetical protein EV188_108195 [Actinomycetospora succinea]|uniref:Uncharacterized protein n=2 Tax=Actinomycetospora succinea TaxID=663603 RepID=A0A4R6V6I3_9PSEU|nr:hypothetical protein EV188_108195 [Actinomycetospora succinea]
MIHLAMSDRWRDAAGILPEGLVRLTVLAALGLVVAVCATAAGLFWAAGALGEAPTDDVEHYGGGRRGVLAWADRYATTGRTTLEDTPDARVAAARDVQGRRALPATVAGARVAASRERPHGVAAYSVTVPEGSVTVTADEGPRGLVDWTLDDGRGTTLRWRHHLADRVPRVTLVDGHGTAWWVRRTSRTALAAEVPDELDPAAARVLVLVVDDQLANARHLRSAMAASGGGGD